MWTAALHRRGICRAQGFRLKDCHSGIKLYEFVVFSSPPTCYCLWRFPLLFAETATDGAKLPPIPPIPWALWLPRYIGISTDSSVASLPYGHNTLVW